MIEPVDLNDKFALFSDHWHPRIVGELNNSYVKLARLKGEFVWHTHAQEDELFLVVSGKLKIRLRGKDLEVRQGQFVVIPHGTEHLPVADEEVQVLLLEPKTTVNTGDRESERTIAPEWI
jgi:mannose-6-phosphate isomerase-like protein (cupin superfamily)